MGGAVFETLEGDTIEIGCDGDSITVNGIKMVNKKDIVTNNGVIHLIDQVLIPDAGEWWWRVPPCPLLCQSGHLQSRAEQKAGV